MDRSAKHIRRNSYIWNAVYSGVNALQPAIILLAVSRTMPLSDAGIITFGFAFANMMMLIARYGIRNFQVTDVNEQYSFSDYFHCRVVSTAAACVMSAVYLAVMIMNGQYSSYKALLIAGIVVLKLMDAFEGVFTGRLQQKGRLDAGACISAVRVILSTAVIFGVILVFKNIMAALLTGMIVSAAADLILIPKSAKYTAFEIHRPDRKVLGALLTVGISLCLGTTLHNIVGNSPRYLVEMYLTDEVQAVSGYLMMPVFVITILNYFIMQPIVKDVGDVWNRKDMARFKRMIAGHILKISILAVLMAAAGVFAGLPLLSWLYNIDLTSYTRVFICYLAGGAVYTLSEYYIVLLVAVRKQIFVVAGCAGAILINLLFGRMLIRKSGLEGTALIYIIANAVMFLVFVTVMALTVRKASKS